MLFLSDDDLWRRQESARRLPKGLELSEIDKLRIAIDDAREMREHQRWRDFAWLLFIAPIWAAFVVWALQLLVRWLTS